MRKERLHGTIDAWTSASRLANSSIIFPGRNECPKTHCGLIEKEKEKPRTNSHLNVLVLFLIFLSWAKLAAGLSETFRHHGLSPLFLWYVKRMECHEVS